MAAVTDGQLEAAAHDLAAAFDLDLVLLFGSAAVGDRALAKDLDVAARDGTVLYQSAPHVFTSFRSLARSPIAVSPTMNATATKRVNTFGASCASRDPNIDDHRAGDERRVDYRPTVVPHSRLVRCPLIGWLPSDFPWQPLRPVQPSPPPRDPHPSLPRH